jgi:uncharacterized protein YfaP (DUF2135 family)
VQGTPANALGIHYEFRGKFVKRYELGHGKASVEVRAVGEEGRELHVWKT